MNKNFDNWRSKKFSGVDGAGDADAYVDENSVKGYVKENPAAVTNMGFVKSYIKELEEMGYKFVDNQGRLHIDSLKKAIEESPHVIIFEEFMKNYSKELKELGFLDENHNGECYMSKDELASYLKIYPQIQENEYFNLHYGSGVVAMRSQRSEMAKQFS